MDDILDFIASCPSCGAVLEDYEMEYCATCFEALHIWEVESPYGPSDD